MVFRDNGAGLDREEIHRFLAVIGQSSKTLLASPLARTRPVPAASMARALSRTSWEKNPMASSGRSSGFRSRSARSRR